MSFVKETLETPVNYSCDVLVAGGGVAGIAAALSAASPNMRFRDFSQVLIAISASTVSGRRTAS